MSGAKIDTSYRKLQLVTTIGGMYMIPKALKRLISNKEEEEKTICSDEIKNKISTIMEKYGWEYIDFEKFLCKAEISVELEKEILEDEEFEILAEFKDSAKITNELTVSNKDESIKIHFSEIEILENNYYLDISVAQNNKIRVYNIEKKKDNNELEGTFDMEVAKTISNDRRIVFAIKSNYIEEKLQFPVKNELSVKIKSAALVHSKAATDFLRKRIERVLAFEDIQHQKQEIYYEVAATMDWLDSSGILQACPYIEIENRYKGEGYDIICTTSGWKLSNSSSSVLIKTAKDSIYAYNSYKNWEYKNGDVSIEYIGESEKYKIEAKKGNTNIEQAIERAEEMSMLINRIKW